MGEIRQFLQGKKTYISAALSSIVALAGWWFGAIDTTNAAALLATAGAVAGLGAKAQRTSQLVLTALNDIRAAQTTAAGLSLLCGINCTPGVKSANFIVCICR
jgi:hypothetical protein